MTQSEQALLVRVQDPSPNELSQGQCSGSKRSASQRDRALDEVASLVRSNDLNIHDLKLALGADFFRSEEGIELLVPKSYDPYF